MVSQFYASEVCLDFKRAGKHASGGLCARLGAHSEMGSSEPGSYPFLDLFYVRAAEKTGGFDDRARWNVASFPTIQGVAARMGDHRRSQENQIIVYESDETSRRFVLLVQRAEMLVLRRLPERLSEELLCDELNVDVKALRKAFRQVRGASPYLALRAVRVVEVKRLLDLNAHLPVETAMRLCGFASYSGFRREFHKRFDVDPKEFPRASWGEDIGVPVVSKGQGRG